jgi:MYXO-CTERM domain-containing protein
MPRFRRLSWSSVIVLGAAAAALFAKDVSAEWPPPESATDLSDPKYWPNDPGYDYRNGGNGQWNYYSFIPGSNPNLRPEETSSGMSIDLAWRYTTGDDSVRIAITDSGIKWTADDLLEKAWLNPRELVNCKPLNADGTACGGTGELAGMDCNGDGILTVSDYAATPDLAPDESPGHPRGDKNNNGVFDAGDIILRCSDGVDDDNNGYVDDISGWDFMKNDNDPYDDTEYGHGTGEANDSTAAANNATGGAGGCPKCRFLAMRVGDSFIADTSDFAKAVTYAADNDVSVVQCALGTINLNSYTQAALDYAYAKGVLTITSMADENARHHNMPATANHTLPVHAIQYTGAKITTTKTFLSYHPCSNYGGQNFLSAAGTGCSSEATGQLSGIAGLVYSAARKYNVSPMLTPGETQSLFFLTADDIDVPESREPDAPYKWSQKGFDQRFGYGRVNANRAVEAVKAGRIPPAVDITEPPWFTVLYADQVTAPTPIVGTVSAKRATSYDYVVEWAPGVQPMDDQFTVFKEEKGLGPDVVSGKDQPLAELDIRTIDPTHERDVDSPNGENDATITIRVRSVAHYGGAIGDVRGELRRTYYVHKDPDLAKGFPLYLGSSGEGSPKMADLDGDGVRELIYPTSDGLVHVYKLTANGPEKLPGFPFRTLPVDGILEPPAPGQPSYLKAPAYATKAVDPNLARESLTSSPAIADIDGDGKPEIVVSTWAGTVYAIGSDGKNKPGWPLRLPDVPSCPLDPTAPPVDPCMTTTALLARGTFASPVLADLDQDGKLDIIQAAFDGKVYAFRYDGSAVPGWPVEVHYTGKLSGTPNKSRILTTPAVADFNGDGIPDLLVGSNERLGAGGQSGGAYLLDGRGTKAPKGTVFPNWPVTMTSLQLFPLIAEGVPNAGVIGTFDGTLAAVMHGNASSPLILPFDPGKQAKLNMTPPNAMPARVDSETGEELRGLDASSIFGPLSEATQPNTFLPLFAQPSLGDLDQDGVPDIIATGGSLNLAINLQAQSGDSGLKGDQLLAMWSGKTGAMMPAAPIVIEDYTFFNSQAVVDLTGDDYPEVLTGTGGYFLRAVDACGREAPGWPKFTGQWIIPTPAVGDLDGDRKLEVAVGTRDGWLYVWHTEATEDSIIEWESFHHDNLNSGNLDTPLTQGKKTKAAKPLTAATCSEEPKKPSTDLEPGGGCGCVVAGEEGSTRGRLGAAALVVAAGVLGARRRRRS